MSDDEAGNPQEDAERAYWPPPKGNTAGTASSGFVQLGDNYGAVNMYTDRPEERLYRHFLTRHEIDKVIAEFVPPAEYERAAAVLAGHVVVLCGVGTGRTYTGHRLLADRHLRGLLDIDPWQPLNKLRPDDVKPQHGYLWDATDHGCTARELGDVTRTMVDKDSYLVVVLNHRDQAPTATQCVVLTAPDPFEVATLTVRTRCADIETPTQILKRDLGDLLLPNTRPERAVRVATYAIDIAAGLCDLAEARKVMKQDLSLVVADSCKGWTTLEYSMMLAVALLENRSSDEVVKYAAKLDEQVRKAELAEDETFKPREFFAQPVGDLLKAVRAELDERPNPWHPDFVDETVRFAQQDWGKAALRHVWRQFPLSREELTKWMFGTDMVISFPNPTVRALCAITTEMPAPDPLWLVKDLAARPGWLQRDLAARALERLANEHNLSRAVENMLEVWIEVGGARLKWTAAVVYGSRYGLRDLPRALDQLARIAEVDSPLVRNAVVRGVLDMLSRPDSRELALERVVGWVDQYRQENLRTTGLALGMWITGITQADYVDLDGLAERYPKEARFLLRQIVTDKHFGPLAFDHLADLATTADWNRFLRDNHRDAAAELVRLTSAVTPDLRWWYRRATVAELGRRHPTKRTMVKLIFQAARKAQRRMAEATH